MGMTIAEKIIAAAAGVDSVKPGDIHTVKLDRLMSNDGTTHLTVDMYNNKLKNPHIADTSKLVFIVIMYHLTARKQQHLRRRCEILQKNITLISGKEKVSAIRL